MASSSHDALVANLCCAYVRHVLYAYYVCTARGVWTGWLADVPEASAVPTSSWALAELCSCVFCASPKACWNMTFATWRKRRGTKAH
eukprot:scaffold34866_cov26-Tisochrysis_lutea.AAC.1